MKGNQLGGSFSLELDGYVTDDLAYDASSTVVEAALEDLGNVGTVSVIRWNPLGGWHMMNDFVHCRCIAARKTPYVGHDYNLWFDRAPDPSRHRFLPTLCQCDTTRNSPIP